MKWKLKFYNEIENELNIKMKMKLKIEFKIESKMKWKIKMKMKANFEEHILDLFCSSTNIYLLKFNNKKTLYLQSQR
jgi:hypothetical protein